MADPETIDCPKHGERPAVPALDPGARADGFTSCRGCWYREWLLACLFYPQRRRTNG